LTKTSTNRKYFNRKQKIDALVGLMRPPNSITAGFAVTTALFLALGKEGDPYNWYTYFLIALTAFLVTAHAMVHNDIIDYEADCISSPFRPLPSKILTMNEAKIWAGFLFIAALTTGLIVDIQLGLSFPISLSWALLNLLILDTYNLWLKKSGLFGNMIVAYVVWALFIYADIIVSHKLTLRVEAIGLYAFFMNWGREVIKGIRDIEGDRQEGIQTIAVRFGANGAAYIGSGLLGLAVLTTIPLIVNPIGNFVIPLILITFNIIIFYRCFNLMRTPTVEYAQSTKRLFLYVMLIALIVLLINQLVLIY
jgi:geranylgeranylglycerol-phosphate geranylgeranyltransferase